MPKFFTYSNQMRGKPRVMIYGLGGIKEMRLKAFSDDFVILCMYVYFLTTDILEAQRLPRQLLDIDSRKKSGNLLLHMPETVKN
ncbi:unnamed protein product [Debaryomyces fabryi]|nr:unnamed protein product [Debaryomyces fabryi]